MSECTHDCSSCGESCADRQGGSPFQIKPLHEGCHVRKVYGVVSGKGGVGKSMVTSQLAVTMQRRGHRTAILDADVTGPSIPKCFGIHGRAVGSEDAILPVQTETGIQLMSVETCCWSTRLTPSSGVAPSSAAWCSSFGATCCGRTWTICSWICPPEPATWL